MQMLRKSGVATSQMYAMRLISSRLDFNVERSLCTADTPPTLCIVSVLLR
jgi:hypothetical protein